MDGIFGMRCHQYRSSRDYERLWELLQHQPIVCIADWKDFGHVKDDPPRRDICSTNWSPRMGATINCRGVTYAMGENLAEFSKECKSQDIEFIEP